MVSARSFVSGRKSSVREGHNCPGLFSVCCRAQTDGRSPGGEEWVEEGSGQRMRNDRWTDGVVSSRTK